MCMRECQKYIACVFPQSDLPLWFEAWSSFAQACWPICLALRIWTQLLMFPWRALYSRVTSPSPKDFYYKRQTSNRNPHPWILKQTLDDFLKVPGGWLAEFIALLISQESAGRGSREAAWGSRGKTPILKSYRLHPVLLFSSGRWLSAWESSPTSWCSSRWLGASISSTLWWTGPRSWNSRRRSWHFGKRTRYPVTRNYISRLRFKGVYDKIPPPLCFFSESDRNISRNDGSLLVLEFGPGPSAPVASSPSWITRKIFIQELLRVLILSLMVRLCPAHFYSLTSTL